MSVSGNGAPRYDFVTSHMKLMQSGNADSFILFLRGMLQKKSKLGTVILENAGFTEVKLPYERVNEIQGVN